MGYWKGSYRINRGGGCKNKSSRSSSSGIRANTNWKKTLVLAMSCLSILWTRIPKGGNRTTNRWIAHAFTTHPNSRIASRSISASKCYWIPKCSSKNVGKNRIALYQSKWDRSLSTEVEEDLDAALENILGGDDNARKAKKKTTGQVEEAVGGDKILDGIWKKDGGHIEGSHPLPENLVEEEDPIDYKSDKFLSTSNPQWVEWGLHPDIIAILSSKGITKFTPVQGQAFQPTVAGRDVIGRSRTGTGKTLAFGLPSMTRLNELATEKGNIDSRSGRRRRGRLPSMLVLCPTRELARQVQEELSTVSKPLGLFTSVFHGGVSYEPQARALRMGCDIVVGTPGRIMDHMDRGNLDLRECDIVVLDEADEMLNMGFAEDVERIMEGVGSENEEKTQCLLFSATTPDWVKSIGRQYQKDVLMIDSTTEEGGGSRVATTVRHLAIQVPPGPESRKQILEDIIAVEISKDADDRHKASLGDDEEAEANPIAYAVKLAKQNTTNAMQQKIFGKTIVFTETKSLADELVSGGVFKSLTAQALHGDIGQKQRDSILAAFRSGAFNVLVATDVAARGIDIQDVDLVVQVEPPRDVDTYVHRSGRTGRAGRKGTSVLLFGSNQARSIVNIERNLGHGFKFKLAGPPTTEAALSAAAKTSAIAVCSIPTETANYFRDAAQQLLSQEDDPSTIVAQCLAAISRRSAHVESRSLLTGESGLATVQMSFNQERHRNVQPADVMYTVSKLSRMSRRDDDTAFDGDVGKIHPDFDTGHALFDMSVDDAKRLISFSKDIDAGGARFEILKEMDIRRGRYFGSNPQNRGRGPPRGRHGNNNSGRFNNRRSSSYGGRGAGSNSGRYQRHDRRPPPRGHYDSRFSSRPNNKPRYDRGGNDGW